MIKKIFKTIITLTLCATLVVPASAATYNDQDITQPSNASVQEIYNMLGTTTYQDWNVATAFKEAEEESGVNAVFLVALTKAESAHGRNKLTQKNNITSVKNKNGSWRAFRSKEECIKCTASMLNRSYLNPNGVYYRGKSIYDVNTFYCEERPGEKHWSNLINNVAYDMLRV